MNGKVNVHTEHTAHLSELASDGMKTHVPFGMTMKKTREFVERQYMPAGFVLHDPHNIPKDEIQEFFDHMKAREVKYGPRWAFLFKVFEDKDYDRYSAQYPGSSEEEGKDEEEALGSDNQTVGRLPQKDLTEVREEDDSAAGS